MKYKDATIQNAVKMYAKFSVSICYNDVNVKLKS